MPTDKSGKKITWKEFGTRWKAGIEGISMLQQTKSLQSGNYIILLGLILGIIASSFAAKTFWWVIIILVGGLFNQIITIIGTKQKIKVLSEMEEALKNV